MNCKERARSCEHERMRFQVVSAAEVSAAGVVCQEIGAGGARGAGLLGKHCSNTNSHSTVPERPRSEHLRSGAPDGLSTEAPSTDALKNRNRKPHAGLILGAHLFDQASFWRTLAEVVAYWQQRALSPYTSESVGTDALRDSQEPFAAGTVPTGTSSAVCRKASRAPQRTQLADLMQLGRFRKLVPELAGDGSCLVGLFPRCAVYSLLFFQSAPRVLPRGDLSTGCFSMCRQTSQGPPSTRLSGSTS
jgi:hypothetical protein